MKIAAVITEFNPFHCGHEYFLREVKRRSGSDRIVAVMSGEFVQRGEPALFGKYARAKAAVLGGCDLVLELPVRSVLSDAGGFALGAFKLIDSLGCADELWFGSEAGRISPLMEAAGLLSDESPAFKARLQSELREGLHYAKARERAYLSLLGSKDGKSTAADPALLQGPNNVLGIEYCIAALKSGSRIRLETIKRLGTPYDKETASGNFPSALSIRRAFERSGFESEAVLSGLPSYASGIFKAESVPLFTDDFSLLLRFRLLEETAESLCVYAGMTPDLARRIKNLENSFSSFTDFALKVKTKNITYSHVSRALFSVLLRLKKEADGNRSVKMLAMKEDAADLLNIINEKGSVSLTSSASGSGEEDRFAAAVCESVRSFKSGLPFIHESSRRFIRIP